MAPVLYICTGRCEWIQDMVWRGDFVVHVYWTLHFCGLFVSGDTNAIIVSFRNSYDCLETIVSFYNIR